MQCGWVTRCSSRGTRRLGVDPACTSVATVFAGPSLRRGVRGGARRRRAGPVPVASRGHRAVIDWAGCVPTMSVDLAGEVTALSCSFVKLTFRNQAMSVSGRSASPALTWAGGIVRQSRGPQRCGVGRRHRYGQML